jgi:hypothetical protein
VSNPVRRDGDRFHDSLSFDFADLARGVAGLVRVVVRAAEDRADREAILIGPNAAGTAVPSYGGAPAGGAPDDWSSVDLGGVRISDDGERARIACETDTVGFAIDATRVGGVSFQPGSAFSDASGLTHEAWAARVDGEWRAGGSSGVVDAFGGILRSSGAIDWTAVELIRSLTAVLEDGSLLALASARAVGAPGHGEETASAGFLDSAGSLTRFEEPLLSTEYDSAGWPRRAGLELWGADDDAPALRGAGTLIAGNEDTAFLRFSFDGTPGTARYELMRAAR